MYPTISSKTWRLQLNRLRPLHSLIVMTMSPNSWWLGVTTPRGWLMESVGPIRVMSSEVIREAMEVTITCVVVLTLSASITNRMFLSIILLHRLSPVPSVLRIYLIQVQATILQQMVASAYVIIRCITSALKSTQRLGTLNRLKLHWAKMRRKFNKWTLMS